MKALDSWLDSIGKVAQQQQFTELKDGENGEKLSTRVVSSSFEGDRLQLQGKMQAHSVLWPIHVGMHAHRANLISAHQFKVG